MRCHKFCALASLLTSLLFALLTLIAGYKNGFLDSTSMATYYYKVNSTVVYHPNLSNGSPSPFGVGYDTILAWTFNTHYLAICAGYMGSNGASEVFEQKDCERRPLGWTFRSNDPFIVHWGETNGSRPVNMTSVIKQGVKTAEPVGLLVAGLVVTVLAAVGILVELFWWKGKGRVTAGVSVGITVAAVLFTASSTLITHALNQQQNDDSVIVVRRKNFFALSWGAAAFMYVAVAGRVVGVIVVQRKRRRVGEMRQHVGRRIARRYQGM